MPKVIKKKTTKKTKSTSKTTSTKKTSKRRTGPPLWNFSRFLHRTLKEVHPELNFSVSKEAMEIVNSLLKDLFERIVYAAAFHTRIKEGRTLTVREIEIAVRSVLPPELAKFAIANAEIAVLKYKNSFDSD